MNMNVHATPNITGTHKNITFGKPELCFHPPVMPVAHHTVPTLLSLQLHKKSSSVTCTTWCACYTTRHADLAMAFFTFSMPYGFRVHT